MKSSASSGFWPAPNPEPSEAGRTRARRPLSRLARTAACLLVMAGGMGGVARAGPEKTDPPVFHTFTQTGKTYAFSGSFVLKAAPSCLMAILFEFDHVKNYAHHVDQVSLNAQGPGWQEVTYFYRRLFYHAEATFRRRMDPDGLTLHYDLTAISSGGMADPGIQAISGYYGVFPESGVCRVTFFQEGRLDADIFGGVYFYLAEKEALAYMREMVRYAKTHCEEKPSP